MISIVLATLAFAALLVLGLTINELWLIGQKLRGVRADVRCPLSGQLTKVRLDMRHDADGPRLVVTSCERFGLVEEPSCRGECVLGLFGRDDLTATPSRAGLHLHHSDRKELG